MQKNNSDDKHPPIPQMPFDDALRKLMNSPPKHKEQTKEQKKTGK
jgi:hypothetical protein